LAQLRELSSFRDNRGFVFWEGGQVYRRINTDGREGYEQLMSSGLQEKLVSLKLAVAHEEVDIAGEMADGAYKVIKPELVPFVSYPFEWSFSQLKDAALATLEIQKLALESGMILRDASAYNIQFVDGTPRLIDTLSLEAYKEGEPWTAYRQFCQHFLAPLVLMSQVDPGLLQLMRVYIDGIPLPLAAKLLPMSSKLRPGLATHIHLHASFQKQHEGTAKRAVATVSKVSLLGLIDSLERTIKRLTLEVSKTEWGDYYNNTNYSDAARDEKVSITADYVAHVQPKRVLDLGGNDGTFSRVATEAGAFVICADIDPIAVDANYQQVKSRHEKNLLPILVDLTNPSPNMGWANKERSSFTSRSKSDMALALALIHHLAIGNNLPLGMVAAFFAELAPYLVIEFVPKSDSKVKRLLATREDIFPDYTREGFEAAFKTKFEIAETRPVKGSDRLMYLMKRRAK
jgi:hypothetical protein